MLSASAMTAPSPQARQGDRQCPSSAPIPRFSRNKDRIANRDRCAILAAGFMPARLRTRLQSLWLAADCRGAVVQKIDQAMTNPQNAASRRRDLERPSTGVASPIRPGSHK